MGKLLRLLVLAGLLMAFDMGFDFRNTGAYVTDPAYGVPVLAEAFPHTYTAANGYSVNGGYTGFLGAGGQDTASTNDARIAGINYFANSGVTTTFQVDLSSGSAPGAGTYIIDLAMGDAVAGSTGQIFQVKDTNTVLIDQDSEVATATGHYLDATLADVAATTTWTGTTVAKAFATTSARLVLNPASANTGKYNTPAHFRLTLVPAGGPTYPQLERGIRGLERGVALGIAA